MDRISLCGASSLIFGVVAWSAGAHAQESATERLADQEESAGSPYEGLEEIVVSAQKRSENLQDVPIAVSVVSGDSLRDSGVGGIQSLKLAIPSVDLNRNVGYVLPSIRGVASKATGALLESPTAVYVDGVYYGATTSTLLSFSNIEQVTVLKGPQGTLFGRNATGGVIQVSTRDPSQTFGGDASIGYGNYETTTGSLYLTGGLTSWLAADVAVQGETMGEGYGTNFFNGEDVNKVRHDIAVRSKWKATLGESTVARLIADYSDHSGSDNAQRYGSNVPFQAGLGPTYGGEPWDTNVNTQPNLRIKSGGASVEVEHELGNLLFTSISAFRQTSFLTEFDTDYSAATAGAISIDQQDRQFSQEFQLQSQAFERFDWTIGAYYFNASSSYEPLTVDLAPPGPLRVAYDTTSKAESIAGFGQANYRITDAWKVTAGIRYTSEERKLEGQQQLTFPAGGPVPAPLLFDKTAKFKKATWRLSTDYQVTDDILVYLSYNRGFKAGGFNPTVPSLPDFKPEILDASEVGIKTALFADRVRLNAAAFYYDYQDVQVQTYVNNVSGVYNGAQEELYGFDADLTAMIGDAIRLSMAYQYLHGEYDSFPQAVIAVPLVTGGYVQTQGDAAGNRTVLAPTSTLSISPSYVAEFGANTVTFSASGYYNSGLFAEPDNVLRQPSYVKVNSSIRWELARGQAITLFVNNLTNEEVQATAGINGLNSLGRSFAIARYSYEPPRTYGVKFETKF